MLGTHPCRPRIINGISLLLRIKGAMALMTMTSASSTVDTCARDQTYQCIRMLYLQAQAQVFYRDIAALKPAYCVTLLIIARNLMSTQRVTHEQQRCASVQ